MKNVGVFFEVPDDSIDNISHLLEPIKFYEYIWLIDNDDISIINDNNITDKNLFKDEDRIIDGERLYNIAKYNEYYTIFVTMYAFPKDDDVKVIRNYNEFLKSNCNIIISIFDSSYVMFWCKDNQIVSNIYAYDVSRGYYNIKYISDKELFERKYFLE